LEKMMNIFKSCQNTGRALALGSLMTASLGASAAIEGTHETVFDLYANQAQISTPDGDSFQIWGFADSAAGAAQYPGPTLIVDEGDMVTITVHNNDVTQQAVSLVFPGQSGITKTCDIGFVPVTESFNGCHWVLNKNAKNDGKNVVAADGGTNSITYTFTANKPGTYMYHSGVSPQIQIDMGLVGTLIVRPATPAPADAEDLAYNDVATAYDSEFLFVMSEMDPKLHYLAELDALDQWDNAEYNSVLFFINGRNAPDTLAGDFAPELPHQPYGSLVQMVPGERVLLRTLNVGRHQHPLHLHGNHYDQIARDGNLLTTAGGTALGAITDYTLGAVPGSTADLLFSWTGKGMGWDIFNSASAHGSCVSGTGGDDAVDNRTLAAGPDGFHDVTWEWCADHGKDIPVVIPENQDLGFGGFYGGSPYLGDVGSLPIGEGGLNPSGGMVFMWHSHSERELTNNDIYPGGMLTMAIVNKR
jgi:FtsP/CotA-like multicopper oxidase with cupredoxin domain